jgi:hypothetical protein
MTLSEEGMKQAQETAKKLQEALVKLRQDFIKACEPLQNIAVGMKNISPHTDRAPSGSYVWDTRPIVQMTRSHMKVNTTARLVTPEEAVQRAMMKPCPVQDELIDWLKEQRKNEIFKREYLARWQSFSPSPLSEEDARKMEREYQREQAAKKRAALESDPEAFGTFGYSFMGIDLGSGENNDGK